MIRLHVPIHHQKVLIVNFAWGQKVVPAGWLPAADRLELRHQITLHLKINLLPMISINLLPMISTVC